MTLHELMDLSRWTFQAPLWPRRLAPRRRARPSAKSLATTRRALPPTEPWPCPWREAAGGAWDAPEAPPLAPVAIPVRRRRRFDPRLLEFSGAL